MGKKKLWEVLRLPYDHFETWEEARQSAKVIKLYRSQFNAEKFAQKISKFRIVDIDRKIVWIMPLLNDLED